MAVVASTRRQGRSSSHSPEYFNTGEQQREREVTMTQPAAYARYIQRVWTNANLAKDFVKVKTYSDLIVLKQDVHDKLGEPTGWVLCAADFDKSPNPAMDKARAEQWMNMYSILDRSTFEENCVRSDQGIVDQFPSREFSDRRSTDWIHPWTMFLSCGKTFSLHFPSIPGLSVSSISRTEFSRYIRQIVTTLPSIIRVCRLLIRRELR
jgi:hypothetical protein